MVRPALQPLTVTGTVDAAFTIYRRRFRDLVIIAAIILVPLTVITYLLNVTVFDTEVVVDPDTLDMTGFWGALIGGLVLAVISYAGTLVISGAVAKTVGDEYVGVGSDWQNSMRKAVDRIWALIGASLLYAIGVFLGLLLFIIPGIYLAIRWVVASVTVILEDRGPTAALSRSAELVRGRWWPVFGVMVLGLIIQFVIGAIVGAIFGAVIFASDDPNSAGVLAASAVIDLVIGIFLQPFVAVLVTVIYFDLRVRKEGFDLDRLADQLDEEIAAPEPRSEWDEGWEEPKPPSEPPAGDSPFG